MSNADIFQRQQVIDMQDSKIFPHYEEHLLGNQENHGKNYGQTYHHKLRFQCDWTESGTDQALEQCVIGETFAGPTELPSSRLTTAHKSLTSNRATKLKEGKLILAMIVKASKRKIFKGTSGQSLKTYINVLSNYLPH